MLYTDHAVYGFGDEIQRLRRLLSLVNELFRGGIIERLMRVQGVVCPFIGHQGEPAAA